jgi:hypothetical protein
MNQNRKDNDLQRAIDEITQKGGQQGGAQKPAPAPQPASMMPPAPATNTMKLPNVPAPAPAPAPQMAMPSMPMGGGFGRPMSYGADISKVKEAALKELFPIMDRVEVEPEKRFLLYQEMLNTMRDKAVIAPAYEAARQIRDDKVRADSLLYLINSIDEMSL